jgi:glycine betaine/proline transport system substrate-binding protein
MKSFSRRTLLGAAAAASTLGLLPTPARAAVITLGNVNLSFYEVTANVIQFLFERKGWNVAVESGGHAQMFPKVAAGDVDVFIAAWLPDAHAVYWKEYAPNLVEVSTLYEDAQLYWAVPDYVDADVRSVADLLRPAVAEKMAKAIRGTPADSGLMIGSRKVFDHYKLAGEGYELVPGPAREWIAGIESRIAAKEWFVTPLWRPQYLNKAHRFRILSEPMKFLGGPNRGVLIANRSFWDGLNKDQRSMLSRIELSLKAVTEMDYWVNVERMSPRDAARRWVGSNPNTVSYWLANPEEDE